MPPLCFVGLPVQLRTLLTGEARRQEVQVTALLVERGPHGTLWFVPSETLAKNLLDKYTASLQEIDQGRIFVFPYAPLPAGIEGEIEAFEDLGGTVVHVKDDGKRFPVLAKHKLDQVFLDHFFKGLVQLFPEPALPSLLFKEIERRNKNFLITKGALDLCDEVDGLRFDFMFQCARVFEDLLKEDLGKTIEKFFGDFGLDHAQTGGILTTLEIHHPDDRIEKFQSNMHLKQGDHTTPAGAARVYYQRILIEKTIYVALMYAGPHPEKNIRRIHHL